MLQKMHYLKEIYLEVINMLSLSWAFFFLVLGFELRTPHLLERSSTTWATRWPFFALVILEIVFGFTPGAGQDLIPSIYTSHIARMTGARHHNQLLSVEIGSQELEPQPSRSQPPP
jgi:hypothetical protein